MSDVNIFYNGTDAFSPQPTPFMGLDYSELYFNEQWAKEETITLEGQLTGCTFALLNTAQQNLLTGFASSYKSFDVKQDGTGIFTRPCVQVESISFAQSPWLGVLPYTIKIKNYPQNYFTGTYGVINPSDNWSYVEQQNEVMEATHTVSCLGINTTTSNNNALDNAKTWAAGRLGTSSYILPTFIPGNDASTTNFFMVSEEEKINRFDGSYSITQKYSNDLTRVGYGTIRYQTVSNQGQQNNLIEVSVNGEVQGAPLDIGNVRTTFASFSPLGVAAQAVQIALGNGKLNPTPIDFSIEEDEFNGKITFSYKYNDDNNNDVYFDYTVTMSQVFGSRNIVSLDGTIAAQKGDLQTRLGKVQGFFNALNPTVLFGYVLPFFKGTNIGSLNPYPISQTYSLDNNKATASVRIQFDDSPVYLGVNRADVTSSVSYPVTQYDVKQILDGQGALSIVDIGLSSLGEINISVKAQTDGDGGENVKNIARQAFGELSVGGNPIAIDVNETTSDDVDGKNIEGKYKWVYNGNSVANVAAITI